MIRYRTPFIEGEHERPKDCCQTGTEECPEARSLVSKNASKRVRNERSHAACESLARRATRVAAYGLVAPPLVVDADTSSTTRGVLPTFTAS